MTSRNSGSARGHWFGPSSLVLLGQGEEASRHVEELVGDDVRDPVTQMEEADLVGGDPQVLTESGLRMRTRVEVRHVEQRKVLDNHGDMASDVTTAGSTPVPEEAPSPCWTGEGASWLPRLDSNQQPSG